MGGCGGTEHVQPAAWPAEARTVAGQFSQELTLQGYLTWNTIEPRCAIPDTEETDSTFISAKRRHLCLACTGFFFLFRFFDVVVSELRSRFSKTDFKIEVHFVNSQSVFFVLGRKLSVTLGG